MVAAPFVDLALLLICGLIIAVAFAYRLTIAQALVWVAAQLHKVAVPIPFHSAYHPLDWLGDLLLSVNGAVLRYLGEAIEYTSAGWKTLWHYQAHAWHALSDAIAGAAEDTYGAIDGLIRRTIPAMIAAALASVLARLAALEAQGKAIVHDTTRTVVHEVTRVERVTVEKTKVVASTIALPRIGPLEREVDDLGKRVRELANRSASAVLAGAVGIALAKLGASWARCSRANRVGNQLCAVDDDLLDALIAGSFLVVSALSLRELATETSAAMGELGELVTGQIRELKGTKAIAFQGYTGAVDGRT